MPYGLVNAPVFFQAFMNDVFRDFLNRFVIVYLDDIVIYSPNMQEHVRHVRRVLRRLLSHGLYTKAEKCEFHQRKVAFLGYNIRPAGISVKDNKVKAVSEWPEPSTVKELQRFLGSLIFTAGLSGSSAWWRCP